MNSNYRDYEIKPIAVDGYADADGVKVDRFGAWLGEVDGETVNLYFDAGPDGDGDKVPAPEGWRSRVIRPLSGRNEDL